MTDDQCSFCGAERSVVRMLVVAPDCRACICEECILDAVRLAVEHKPPDRSRKPKALPQEFANERFVRSRDLERYGGLVYAVATVPDMDVRRLKIGYTTRPIERRLDAFRTANPTASLLGLWSAPLEGEDVAHRLIDGRLRTTEVFHVPDVLAAICALDEETMSRWP